MDTQRHLSGSLGVLGIVLGLSLILSSLIGAYAFYTVRMADNTLSVTGSASTEVVSDQVKWVASISRQVKASGLKAGYAQIAADLEAVRAFYSSRGIDLKTLTISPVSLDEVYNYNPNGTVQEKEYNLRQIVEISSGDVNAITAIAHDASDLVSQGVIFQTQGLEYYYSKLPELRVSLLADAIRDARARAEKIAEPSGQKVGVLKSASSGVVQVLPLNSVEVSDYGTYDTSKIQKKVMVTVRAAFTIR